jgi:hypothetical protein
MIRPATASTNAPIPNLPATILSDVHLPIWRLDTGGRPLRAMTQAHMTKAQTPSANRNPLCRYWFTHICNTQLDICYTERDRIIIGPAARMELQQLTLVRTFV